MADSKAAQLQPSRALLSPAWLLALALLIINDHALKGAGLLPEWLTGKLSDVAGMVVAPVLLAALIGVRRRATLLACHVAVALVFAAIQLWPAFAALWSAGMGVLGYPWTITADATDLLALPALGLGWALLTPHMDPQAPPLAPLQRSAVAALAILGLWSSVATTEAEPWDFEPVYEDVFGNVFVNNNNDDTIAIHVRLLREEVVLRCDVVAEDPGRLLSEAAFGDAEHWSLPAWTNVGIEVPDGECGAVWIAGEGVPPTILFFFVEDFPAQWWPGRVDTDGEPFGAGLGLRFGEEGPAEWIAGDAIRFTPRTDTPPQPPGCAPPLAESRIDWSDDIPSRPVALLALDAGIDGCFEMQLQDQQLVQGELSPIDDPYNFYLCAPADAVPFTGGELLSLSETGSAIGARELTITLLDPLDLEPATDAGRLVLNLRLLRGGNHPQFIGPAVGRELEAVVDAACPWSITEGCATVQRSTGLRVVGGTNVIEAGESAAFADDPGPGALVRLAVLAYMREFAVVDSSCAGGSLVLDYDIDIAVIEQPLL